MIFSSDGSSNIVVSGILIDVSRDPNSDMEIFFTVNNLLPPPRDQILKSQPLVDRTKTDTSTPVVASYAEADVHSYVPDDAEWVDVELEICGDGTRRYWFNTDTGWVRVGGNDWQGYIGTRGPGHSVLSLHWQDQ